MLDNKSLSIATQTLLMKTLNPFPIMDVSYKFKTSRNSFGHSHQIHVYLELE